MGYRKQDIVQVNFETLVLIEIVGIKPDSVRYTFSNKKNSNVTEA